MTTGAITAHARNADLHADFLAILPKIEAHAAIAFRFVACEDRKADMIHEAVALSWLWFKRLREQGKNPTEFPTAIAGFAARAVASGRRLCGQESSRDVLSILARRKKGFFVTSLPDHSTAHGNPWDEALQDNTQTPVPDAVAFKIDFPSWLTTLTPRNRDIAEDMAVGHHTQELAERHNVSPARISQLRREFHTSWTSFTEPAEPLAV
jgi:hypothetical protein